MDFLLNILSHWESALAVLLVLGGLIFFHELGHFAVARLFRICAPSRWDSAPNSSSSGAAKQTIASL